MRTSCTMASGVPYVNRMVRINLRTGEITKSVLDAETTRKFVGGYGIGIKLLYDEVPPETVKPFDPENKLIFQAAPLNGTKYPGSGIVHVSTLGPLTDLMTSAQSNGYFGARMRHVGYETIIIEDVAPEWSILVIRDDGIELRPAGKYLGMGTWQLQDELEAEIGGKYQSTACIGPAGENLVHYASIECDHGHVVATNGPGAVMGSKKLKAIIISTEHNSVDTWADDFVQARKDALEAAAASGLGNMVKRVGTLGYFDNLPPRAGVPTKNYSTNVYDYEQFSMENREEWADKTRTTCWGCPWAHTGVVKIKKGKAKGFVAEEPEFEPLAGFTTNMGNDDMGEGIRLCYICEDLGFDGKEMSFVISLVIECFEKGLLTLEDTGGLELTWGNTEAVDQLLKDIAHRRGFGAKLYGGVKKICEMIGGEALNFGVYSGRGIAPNVVDERMTPMAYYNLTLSETGSFGGFAGPDPEVGNNEPLDPTNFAQIGWYLGGNNTKWLLMDVYGSCFFYSAGKMGPVVQFINLVTGWDMDNEEMLTVGERVKSLARAYNIRAGLTKERELAVSPRFSQPPVDGPTAGVVTKLWDLDVFENFYKRNGWDVATSKPLPETLKKLGLEYVIPDLWKD